VAWAAALATSMRCGSAGSGAAHAATAEVVSWGAFAAGTKLRAVSAERSRCHSNTTAAMTASRPMESAA
jgi:hypothetical protein